ncbi:MAG: Dabb family protein [Planctomycetota bacterium]
MLHHTVHFWLKPDTTDAQRADFVAGLKSLADSPNVVSVSARKPAGTPREVVDNSYDYQLFVVFKDQASHDIYQSPDDAVHQKFVDAFVPLFDRVLIYDSVEA